MQAGPAQPHQLNPASSPSLLSSCVDPISKLQSNFLQKFFKWNIVDHFHSTFLNLQQDLLQHRPKSKYLRQLSAEIFVTRQRIDLEQFEKKIDFFYRINNKDLTESFKMVHCNDEERNGRFLKEGEIVAMRVRMRVDVEKIQGLPLQFYQDVQLSNQDLLNLSQEQKQHFLQNVIISTQRHLNLFIIYFGDSNFHIFNSKAYNPKTINFLGQTLQVRIFVFFISRYGMIQKFKRLSRLASMQGLNDLLIQLYELKRERMLARRGKQRQKIKRKPNKVAIMITLLKWIAFASIFGVLLIILITRNMFRRMMPAKMVKEW